MVTYQDVLPTARKLAMGGGDVYCRHYINKWNHFEDYLKGKISFQEAQAILFCADNEIASEGPDAPAAMVIHCMLT